MDRTRRGLVELECTPEYILNGLEKQGYVGAHLEWFIPDVWY